VKRAIRCQRIEKTSTPTLRRLQRSPDRIPEGPSVTLRAPLICRLLRGTTKVRGLPVVIAGKHTLPRQA
jgi:hypothetical protein